MKRPLFALGAALAFMAIAPMANAQKIDGRYIASTTGSNAAMTAATATIGDIASSPANRTGSRARNAAIAMTAIA
jgi:hypothetical protein